LLKRRRLLCAPLSVLLPYRKYERVVV